MKLQLILAVALVASGAFAYQVTGPVLEVTPSKIVVKKGAERWEVARDASTKVTGEVKVGSKVTVEYKMIATDIASKDGAKTSEKKAAKPKRG